METRAPIRVEAALHGNKGTDQGRSCAAWKQGHLSRSRLHIRVKAALHGNKGIDQG